MKLKNWSLIVAALFGISQSVIADTDTLTYKNNRGSILMLQILDDDTVKGTFSTAVATKECQTAIGISRPILGFVAKNAISFSVNYPECGSAVSFTGYFEADKKIIDATAIIVHGSSDVGATMLSHDVFKLLS